MPPLSLSARRSALTARDRRRPAPLSGVVAGHLQRQTAGQKTGSGWQICSLTKRAGTEIFRELKRARKKAALMRPFSCPTGTCSSRKCSPSQARQNPAVSLPGVAAIRLHHSSLKSAEHGRQSIAPASGMEQARQKLVPSGKAFCCRMPCDAFSGNSPPNILYLSTGNEYIAGIDDGRHLGAFFKTETG